MLNRIVFLLAAGFVASAFVSTAHADYRCRLANGQMAICRGGMAQTIIPHRPPPIIRARLFPSATLIRPAPRAAYAVQEEYHEEGYVERRRYGTGGTSKANGPCPLGGDYDEDAKKCVISGGPTPEIANDRQCKDKPVGFQFDVPITGPHGELGVDHRVCGSRG